MFSLSFSVQVEESNPSEIFRTYSADLSEAIATDLDRVTDRLFAVKIIGQSIVQFTTTEGVSNYCKARKVVHELFNLLQGHRNPKQYLTEICNVLLKQDNLRLRDIIISLLSYSCYCNLFYILLQNFTCYDI